METRTRKRKQYTSPPNPYARVFVQRRRNRINNNPSAVKDLRSRRVFSLSVSDVKGSIEVAEDGKKGSDIKVGFAKDLQQVEEKTQIDESIEKSDLGFAHEVEIDLRVSQKDQIAAEKGEIESGRSFDDESIQTIISDGEMVGKSEGKVERDCEKTPKVNESENRNDGSVGEGGGGEQPRSKSKPVVLAPCSRSKLYKNPSSFSYRRLLPFLMDIRKDNSDALQTHPCQKTDKPMEEGPPPSSSTSPDIVIDIIKNKVSPSEHSLTNTATSNGSPTTLSSSMRSPEHVTKSSNLKTPTPEDMQDKSIKSQDASSFVNEADPPPNLSFSHVTPSSIKEGGERNLGCLENNGNTEIDSDYGEWIQSTPPDSDVFCRPEPDTSKDASLEIPSNNRSIHEKTGCVNEAEKDRQLNSKDKLGVLVPCSRMKLYKTPSSFSYRRLLPFLTDLAKTGADKEAILPREKVDKSPNEVSPPLFIESQEALEDRSNEVLINSDGIPNPELTIKTSPTGLSTSDCSNLEPIEVPTGVTSQDSISESLIQEPPVTSTVFTANGSVNPESPHEPLGPSEKLVSMSGSSMGILKRQRRGCRGICTCLSCASFRLHAEKAFEFSRNQMEDTEEVTIGLVKELSNIRTLLEKSIDRAESHAIVQLPQVELKEVCAKALKAEKVAKIHLNQMNQELNIHCRTPSLQRPRVTFVEHPKIPTVQDLSFR